MCSKILGSHCLISLADFYFVKNPVSKNFTGLFIIWQLPLLWMRSWVRIADKSTILTNEISYINLYRDRLLRKKLTIIISLFSENDHI
jgi:hypothetical protein